MPDLNTIFLQDSLMNVCGSCADYEFRKCINCGEGRQLQVVGNWSKSGNKTDDANTLFTNQFEGFNGRKLRIAVVHVSTIMSQLYLTQSLSKEFVFTLLLTAKVIS